MHEASGGPGLREHLMVLARFLRSPRTVGALSASSRALAMAVVDCVDWERAERVVELGPGTGALTGAIVEHLRPETRFFAVDIDEEFVRKVKQRWPSVECVCGSAEELEALARSRDLLPVDHIISGLPFTTLAPAMTAGILDGVYTSLRPGGKFTTFQYVYTYGMSNASKFRSTMSERMRSKPVTALVKRNVPPARVLTWTKPDLQTP